jgi:hypothetical protein
MTRHRARTAAAIAALIPACLVVGSIVYLAESHTTTKPVPSRTYRGHEPIMDGVPYAADTGSSLSKGGQWVSTSRST